MRDLIDYLEMEMDMMSGPTKKKMQNWIDQLETMIPELKEPVVTSARPGVYRNSTSDIRGVHYLIRPAYGKGETIRTEWTSLVRWDNHCKIKHSYSVEKYGFIEAYKMACIMTYIVSGPLHIRTLKNLPCEPPVPYEIKRRGE